MCGTGTSEKDKNHLWCFCAGWPTVASLLLFVIYAGDSNQGLSDSLGISIFPLSLFDTHTCKLSHVTEALTPKICVNKITQS